jgi:hypothetical protein
MTLFGVYEPSPEYCRAVLVTSENIRELAEELVSDGCKVNLTLSPYDGQQSLTVTPTDGAQWTEVTVTPWQWLVGTRYHGFEVVESAEFRNCWRRSMHDRADIDVRNLSAAIKAFEAAQS